MALRIQIQIALGLLTFFQVTCQCQHGDLSNNFTRPNTVGQGQLKWEFVHGQDNDGFPPGAYEEDDNNDCYYWLANGGYNGDKALLMSPCLTIQPKQTATANIKFAYYLSEENTGNLTLYWRDGCLDQPPQHLPDYTSGNESLSRMVTNAWVPFSYNFDVFDEFQIFFEAVMNEETNNSVAIDDIFIANASISTTTTVGESIRTTMLPVPSTAATLRTDLEMKSPTEPSSISEREHSETLSDYDATTTTMTTSNTYDVTTPNITLNFCEMHSITNGLDNCTFIGLMFAGVPLVIIFLLWLACYVYNRYCRNCITDPEKQQRRDDDQDGENRKDSYSANYAYVNSVTDHTYASVHPFGNGLPDEETKDKKDGLDDKKTVSSGNDYDNPVKDSNGQNGSVGEVKSSPKDTRLPKDSDVLIVAGSDDADSDYTELNRIASEKLRKGDAQEEQNETSTYSALNLSSPSESNETSTLENEQETSEISATEESPYFVLEGPTRPSPPSTPVPTLRRNKGVNNDEIVYDLLNDNVPQEKTSNKEPEKAEDESLYFKLAGPTPPSPLNSPHPAMKEPLLTEEYPKEDEYDLLTSESPKEDEYDLLDRGHPLFTTKVDSDKHVNEPVTSDSDESIDGFAENNDETKPDQDRNMNETYNGIYDRPRIPAVRALGVDDSIDSDVSEDTYM